jgi:sporulation protein YlmC with PRC-barrel domain
MKTMLYTTAAALIAIANPASAQILGGGGGGILGGGLPPIPVMPNIPVMSAPINVPVGPVSSVTSGSVTGAATAGATKSIDTHTGKASANGSAKGSATGSLTQSLETPLNSVTANGAGSGNAAGSAGADAQLFGTDAVRGTLHQTHDAAGNLVTTFKDHAGNLVTATRDHAGNLLVTTRDHAGILLSSTGSLQGNATGSASGAFSGLSHNLALDGSAAGDAAGSFDVKPGTSLFDMNGQKIGKVREVFADGAGHVKGLLVKCGDTTALLPVSDFAANGNALVSSMTQSQIAATGNGQANGTADGSANGIFSGLSHNLALSGSTAADLTGSFDIKSGTQLYDMAGEKIGKVKEVIADAHGRVRALVVKVEDTTATLPAADFAANGDVLVTAMSEAQIVSKGEQQASGTSAPQQTSEADTAQTQSAEPASSDPAAGPAPAARSARGNSSAQPAGLRNQQQKDRVNSH